MGEIGSTILTALPDGQQLAQILPSAFPTDKEELENRFASLFVDAHNSDPRRLGSPLGTPVRNVEHDLDFVLHGPDGGYLELGEICPLSEPFGRSTARYGRYDVFEYCRWIWLKIIDAKQRKYGQLAARVRLLLYATHWQFLPSNRTIQCLQSMCATYGCHFLEVYVLLTNGSDLAIPMQVHPAPAGLKLPRPKDFHFTITNLPPGQAEWHG